MSRRKSWADGFFKAGGLIRLLVHVRGKQMVEVEITEENLVMLSLSTQPTQPAPFTSTNQSFSCLPKQYLYFYAAVIHTQPIAIQFCQKGIIEFFNLIVEHLSWWIEVCLQRHHNSPEKILIHRLCVSLLTRDGFLVISAGFLEVPVGLVYPHWLAQKPIYTVENCFGIVSHPCTVKPI